MNRQRLALFILVIVFALAAAWSYRSMPRLKTVGPSGGARSPQAAPPAAEQNGTADKRAPQEPARFLRLDLVEHAPQGFKGYRRNLFQPLFVDEVKAMKQKASAVKPLVPLKPVVDPKSIEPPKPAQPEALQRELARFTFLGFLKKGDQKTIFLSKDKDIVLVRAGEKFGGRYEVSSITDQALTILVPDTGEEIVIPLLESKPLAAAKQ